GEEGVGERRALGGLDVGEGDARCRHPPPVDCPVMVRYVYAIGRWGGHIRRLLGRIGFGMGCLFGCGHVVGASLLYRLVEYTVTLKRATLILPVITHISRQPRPADKSAGYVGAKPPFGGSLRVA